MAKFKRILLKLSGESLMGTQNYGIDTHRLNEYAEQISQIVKSGVQVGIVIGGGNIFRGLSGATKGFDRVKGDQMGMLATVINSMAIRDILSKKDIDVRLFSSLPITPIAEPYLPRNARKALDDGAVAIFSGGTGNPFVSTDTAAVLRACDIGADAVLKATKVDGIYASDPEIDPKALRYDRISYDEALKKGLAIMDLPAIALARENNIPVIVFNFWDENSIARVLRGDNIGTVMD